MTKDKQNYFTLKFINPVIRVMTLSDFVVITSFGLIAPIFAVFITDGIKGGDVAVAGIAEAVYLTAKSLFQIPFAFLVDKIKGEKDDFWAITIGTYSYCLIPLLYLIIDTPWELYLVQLFYGLATAAVIPSWNAIFMRHIDKGHEGVESGVYSTLTSLGGAIAASLGGLIAVKYGFEPLFVLVSIISFFGASALLLIHKNLSFGKGGKNK